MQETTQRWEVGQKLSTEKPCRQLPQRRRVEVSVQQQRASPRSTGPDAAQKRARLRHTEFLLELGRRRVTCCDGAWFGRLVAHKLQAARYSHSTVCGALAGVVVLSEHTCQVRPRWCEHVPPPSDSTGGDVAALGAAHNLAAERQNF